MGKKRKRPGKSSTGTTGTTDTPKLPVSTTVKKRTSHPVISLYYREVVTLRQYLLRQLPATSKSRRRRIASLGSTQAQDDSESGLVDLLDSALVGVLKESSPSIDSERQRDYLAFTQSQSRSILVSTDTGPTCPQSEVVDFVIWRLFNHASSYQRPQHMLAHGFQRPSMRSNAMDSNIPGVVVQFPNHHVQTLKEAPWADVLGLLGSNGEEIMMRLLFDCGLFASIGAKKGIFYQLSGLPLSALEPVGETCSRLEKFASLKRAVSGVNDQKAVKQKTHWKDNRGHSPRALNSILFLRRRMLYARTCESEDNGQFGLGQSHVLNRFSSLESMEQTVHVMKYIFPRQFGLNNVFTLPEDSPVGVEPFKNYAFREDEICRLNHKKRERQPRQADAGNEPNGQPKLPKRLRGQVVELVRKLRVRQRRCPYKALLKHYCPSKPNGPWRLGTASQPGLGVIESSMEEQLVTQVQADHPSSGDGTSRTPCQSSMLKSNESPVGAHGTIQRHATVPKPKTSLTDFATPAPSVSAFCRAVLQKLIPLQFYGNGVQGVSNRKRVLKNVDCFIKMRRFESLSLHEVCRGLKVTNIPWLEPPHIQNPAGGAKHKLSLPDFQKRTELLHEFIYYVFDSIVIPLIRSIFYVTESQTHRNRLFYFRHDVWKRLTEQPLADLKASMFEELEPGRAQQVLTRRSLGFGALRLLPKPTGLRPILNLRKRVRKETIWGGRRRSYLAPSVNSSITPIYNMLTYERQRAPAKLGSTLLSVGEMHLQLKRFKDQLFRQMLQLPAEAQESRVKLPALFFVKLDIQACFDTIPQKKLIRLIEDLVSEKTYHVSKHMEIQPPTSAAQRGKILRKFVGRAAPGTKPQHLPDTITSEIHGRHANTVFIDTGNQKIQDAEELLDLLDEHVRKTVVKIGKSYYRQRSGIPQGSVLSSLLCNFFYAELEQKELSFLRPEDALLLRLVDDFLLITPDADLAMQFLRVMIRGQPSYGVSVNPAKSLVNFTAAVDGIHIPRLEGSSLFPYLGSLIDTHTLEIHRNQDRIVDEGESAAVALSNSLTVETTRMPGQAFHRKVLASFRLHMQAMYIDDAHNSRPVVLANLYTSFVTSAMKMYRYMKSLRGRAHPGPSVVIGAIHDLIQQTSGMIQAQRAAGSSSGFACSVQRSHLRYLAATAIRFVLVRKQTRYATVLRWLDCVTRQARPAAGSEARLMAQVVRKGNMVFRGWRF